MPRFLRAAALACALVFPVPAFAQRTLNVWTGIQTTLPLLMMRIISFLASSAVAVCTALFVVGAFYVVFFAHQEEKVKTGKDIMMGSLIGLAVVLGSYGILRTAYFFLIAP